VELLLVIIGVVAIMAFRRAGRAERLLAQQRIELSQLRTMVQTLTDRVDRPAAGIATPTSTPTTAPSATAAGPLSPEAALPESGAAPSAAGSEPAATPFFPRHAAVAAYAAADVTGSVPPVDATTAGAAPPLDAAPGTPAFASPRDISAGAADAAPLRDMPPGATASMPLRGAPAGATGSARPHDMPLGDMSAGAAASGGAPPLPRTATVATGPSPLRIESIESRIGGRWLLYIGVAALVLGASYFVKYAFDNEWINQPMRVILGLIGGAALTLVGQRFVQAGYTLYGQALSGGGIGILYLAIFAAHRWYELIGRPVAFTGMVLITALAAWLSDRQRSQLLALMAVTVGFGTPFLIGGDSDAQVTLFTYDAILVAGTLYLARRRSWPALDLVSYVLTLLTIASWAEAYYTPGAYLVTELFLTLFLVLFLFVLREHWAAASINPLAALVQVTLSLAPLLYHVASLSILFSHNGALLVYLIAFTVAGLILARSLHVPWLRIIIWIGAALPFYVFAEQRVSRGWLIAAWITLLAIYGLHLLSQVHRLDEERTHLDEERTHLDEERLRMPRMPATEIFLLHANGLWMLFCVEALISPRRADEWVAGAAFALAAWYAGLAAAAWRWHREAALHAIAWASALVAIGCAIQFEGPWLIVSLATEGAVLIWLALRSQRPWVHACGAALLAIASLRAIALLAEPAPVGYWTLFNPRALATLFIVGLMYALAWLHARNESTPGGNALARATLIIAANALTLIVLSTEIDAFFERRAWQTGAIQGIGAETAADVARELTLSVAWALYAVLLVAIGIGRNYRPIRYFAILVFALTIGKVFLVDISTLDRVYKMLSVMALGVLLLIASYLYQRLRTELRDQDAAAP